MQSISSRIWTRVAVSISYDDNDYTTGTSYSKRYGSNYSLSNDEQTGLFNLGMATSLRQEKQNSNLLHEYGWGPLSYTNSWETYMNTQVDAVTHTALLSVKKCNSYCLQMQAQILNNAVCISLWANALGKGMNLSVLIPNQVTWK